MKKNKSVNMFILFYLPFSVGCTSPFEAKETLIKSGYKNIETFGYGWLACGRDDFFSTKFKAENVNGESVEGVVCCGGVFKNCTIRF